MRPTMFSSTLCFSLEVISLSNYEVFQHAMKQVCLYQKWNWFKFTKWAISINSPETFYIHEVEKRLYLPMEEIIIDAPAIEYKNKFNEPVFETKPM